MQFALKINKQINASLTSLIKHKQEVLQQDLISTQVFVARENFILQASSHNITWIS